MPLHLHRSERADALAGGLAALLSRPLTDPFAGEVVAVPTRGIERWLAQTLSGQLGCSEGRSDGICAGVDFPSPSRLASRALAGVLGLDREDDPWRADRLTWPVLAELEAARGEAWASIVWSFVDGSRGRFGEQLGAPLVDGCAPGRALSAVRRPAAGHDHGLAAGSRRRRRWCGPSAGTGLAGRAVAPGAGPDRRSQPGRTAAGRLCGADRGTGVHRSAEPALRLRSDPARSRSAVRDRRPRRPPRGASVADPPVATAVVGGVVPGLGAGRRRPRGRPHRTPPRRPHHGGPPPPAARLSRPRHPRAPAPPGHRPDRADRRGRPGTACRRRQPGPYPARPAAARSQRRPAGPARRRTAADRTGRRLGAAARVARTRPPGRGAPGGAARPARRRSDARAARHRRPLSRHRDLRTADRRHLRAGRRPGPAERSRGRASRPPAPGPAGRPVAAPGQPVAVGVGPAARSRRLAAAGLRRAGSRGQSAGGPSLRLRRRRSASGWPSWSSPPGFAGVWTPPIGRGSAWARSARTPGRPAWTGCCSG